MWEKIETFLFDLIGLLLPGIVFLVGVISTFFMLIGEETLKSIYTYIYEIPFITFISGTFEEIKGQILLIVLLFFLHAYLAGHVIKVFSKIFYSFLVIVFDTGLNKMFLHFTNKFRNKKIEIGERNSVQIFWGSLLGFLKTIVGEIFIFKPSDYEKANESLLEESKDMINSKFKTEYPESWYSFYKLAKIVISHENLQSMNETFLAKYNLYRSLSFITFLQICLILIINSIGLQLNAHAEIISLSLVIINFIFGYTFHEKYKRYFRLCGNEVLVALYYYLKKESLSIEASQ